MSNFTLTQQGADSFVYDPITLTYSYTVDVSPGETVSLSGDINLVTGGDVYVLGQLNYISIYSMLTPAPGWGDFSLNLTTGIFTFTFTADTLATNGGPQTIPLMFLASNGMFGQEALLVEFTITCFCAGTLIATPLGETPVQDLRIGDQILTACGRPVPVKWIGRQTVSTRFGPAERSMPVRIAAGALGHHLPHTDLTVTADHAMLVGGVLCHAGALVNGTTITRVPLAEMGEHYTVYHIETEAHEIILANGAPAETFIDNVSRRVFDNFAEFETLYGDVPEMMELPLPRAMSARQVPVATRARLSNRPENGGATSLKSA